MMHTCGTITAQCRPTEPRSATAPHPGPRWSLKRSSSDRLCRYMFVSATTKMDAVPAVCGVRLMAALGMIMCNMFSCSGRQAAANFDDALSQITDDCDRSVSQSIRCKPALTCLLDVHCSPDLLRRSMPVPLLAASIDVTGRQLRNIAHLDIIASHICTSCESLCPLDINARLRYLPCRWFLCDHHPNMCETCPILAHSIPA
jgi:hypothetical protein